MAPRCKERGGEYRAVFDRRATRQRSRRRRPNASGFLTRATKLCALLLLLPLAARGSPGSLEAARLLPAGVDAALLLDSADALAGPRAFVEVAGKLAPIVGPQELGRLLEKSIGVDVVAAPRDRFGLQAAGPRAVALLGHALGASFPVANAAQARAALDQWLAEVGKPKATQLAPGAPGKVAGSGKHARAGALLRVAGSDRLLLASGAEAPKLLAGLASAGRKRRPLSGKADIAAELKKAAGPAVLYLRGEPPLRAAVLSLSGAASYLAAEGIVLPLGNAPLLAGPPPAAPACDGEPLLCARAGLGKGGRQLLGAALTEWARLALPKAQAALLARISARLADSLTGPVALRSPLPDLEMGSADPLWALGFMLAGAQRGFALEGGPLPRWATRTKTGLLMPGPRDICLRSSAERVWLGDACDEPVFEVAVSSESDSVASLDAPGLGRLLHRASPFSALRGSLPAAVYTARLLFARLLEASGPLTARARPQPGQPAAAHVELRWPLP